MIGVPGCSGCDTVSKVVNDETSISDTQMSIEGQYDVDFFTELPLENHTVTCTLENGTTTTCYELTFAANTEGNTEREGIIGTHLPNGIATL
ncbi:hypothetical protein [Paraglaciecola sp.]|uniref:hypothetical protein n=1 Tax=Paraglaciecola sp. TaxID=1920173 RepID=UPI003265B2E6